MRQMVLLFILAGALLLPCTGLVLAQTNDNQRSAGKAPLQKHDPDTVPGQYIVVLKDDVSDPTAVAREHAQKHGAEVLQTYQHAIKSYAARIPAAQLDKLRDDSRVEFVSEDHEVQAVGTVPLTSGDSNPTGVRRIGAGTDTTAHSASTERVAVIDAGIDLTHPDLNAKDGKNCVRTKKKANDDNGHGSHVAGTIGALNNGSGVAGVAPGTELYAVKVLNSAGSGTWSQIICGIDWVTGKNTDSNTDNDIKVANMGLGGSGTNDNNCGNTNSDALQRAICKSTKAGVTYAIAAGNSGANFKNFTPAAYPEALTVTAASDSDGSSGGTGGAPTCRTGESDDSYASFSNYAGGGDSAAQNHTIAGSGVCIKST